MTATNLIPSKVTTNLFINPSISDLKYLGFWTKQMKQSFVCSSELVAIDRQERYNTYYFLELFSQYLELSLQEIHLQKRSNIVHGMNRPARKSIGNYYDGMEEPRIYMGRLNSAYTEDAILSDFDKEDLEVFIEFTERIENDLETITNNLEKYRK